MKTIPEIEAMENKAVIDSFEGHIKKVFSPQEPTDPQKEAGIHKQGIIIRTAAGEMIVGLMKKHFHMDSSMEGQKFRFESTKDDSGKLGGLDVGKWKKNGESKFAVNVWGNAVMYAVDAPANHDQSAKKEQQEAQPKGTESGNPDSMDWARNYFSFYRAAFDIAADKMNGSKISPDGVKEILTSKMIRMERGGDLDAQILAWLKGKKSTIMPIEKESLVKAAEKEFDAKPVDEQPKSETSPDNNQKEVDTEPEPEKPAEDPKEKKPIEKDWKKVAYKKKVVSEMSKEDLIDVCIKVLPHHETDTPAIKMVLKAAMKSKVAMELSYEQIYDVYDVMLKTSHNKATVDAAYDSLKKKGKSDDELCKEILFEQDLFVEIIKSHEPQE